MLNYTADLVSTPEYQLLEAIKEVKYGELFGVQVDDQDKWIDYELSQAEIDLLNFIREGAQYIDILTVHKGQPTQAETDYRLSGFRCRKRIKFPIRKIRAGKRDE